MYTMHEALARDRMRERTSGARGSRGWPSELCAQRRWHRRLAAARAAEAPARAPGRRTAASARTGGLARGSRPSCRPRPSGSRSIRRPWRAHHHSWSSLASIERT